VLCRHLSGEWAINEQYNYGWFVPFFCAYLFWLRWENRPESEVPPSVAAATFGVAGRGQRSERRNEASDLVTRLPAEAAAKEGH